MAQKRAASQFLALRIKFVYAVKFARRCGLADRRAVNSMRHVFSFAGYRQEFHEASAKAMLAGFVVKESMVRKVLEGSKSVSQALKKIREFVLKCLVLQVKRRASMRELASHKELENLTEFYGDKAPIGKESFCRTKEIRQKVHKQFMALRDPKVYQVDTSKLSQKRLDLLEAERGLCDQTKRIMFLDEVEYLQQRYLQRQMKQYLLQFNRFRIQDAEMKLEVLYALRDVFEGCAARKLPGFETIVEQRIREIGEEGEVNESELVRVSDLLSQAEGVEDVPE